MSTSWTLLAGTAEKTLANWGICADFSFGFANKEKGVMTFRTTEDFDPASPHFSPESKIIIYRDRQLTDHGGPIVNTGTIYFQGYIATVNNSARGSKRGIQYVAYDARWYMEREPFKQAYKNFAGWLNNDPTQGAVLVDQVASEVYIGEDQNENLQTTKAQLTEIYAWLNRVKNPTWRTASSPSDASLNYLAIGTITPDYLFPRSRVNTISCAEAEQQVLRWTPDAIAMLDYTTQPPTINVRSLASMPTATIQLTAEQESAISVTPDIERQLAGVIIYYKWTNTVNGRSVPNILVDRYPLDITDFDPDVSSHTVNLIGLSATTLECAVETEPVANISAVNAAGRVAWWTEQDASLQDASIDRSTLSITPAWVTDVAGVNIDLNAYPNILLTNALPDWVAADTVHAVISATVSYDKHSDSNLVLPTQRISREVRKDVVLTNAVTKTYSQTTHYDPGETPPGWVNGAFVNGVAEQVYKAVKDLRHRGTITFVSDALRYDLVVGTRCTLVGPHSTFENCIIQRIETQPHYGRMTITFGPAARLDAPGLIELARASRNRQVLNIPSGRATGQFGGSGTSVPQTAAIPRDNTTHGTGQYALQTAIFQQLADLPDITGTAGVTQVGCDAQNETIQLQRKDPTTGARIETAGYVDLALADASDQTWDTETQASKVTGQAIKLRRMIDVSSDGNIGYRLVACSDRYHQAADDGTFGFLRLYRIAAVHDTYLTCRTWDGILNSAFGDTDVYVARGFKNRYHGSRSDYASDVIDGVYQAYTDATDTVVGQVKYSQRNVEAVVNAGPFDALETVYPDWKAGDPIYAMPCDHTGVFVGDVELKLIYVETCRPWVFKSLLS